MKLARGDGSSRLTTAAIAHSAARTAAYTSAEAQTPARANPGGSARNHHHQVPAVKASKPQIPRNIHANTTALRTKPFTND